MRHPATRNLFAVWNHWRGEERAPEREKIDPTLLRSVLADTFVVEADRERTWPVKSLGARTRCLVASDPGRSFLDLWHSDDRADVELMLSGAQEDCVPMQATARAEPAEREPIGLDLLLLPLQHLGQPDRRLIGALVPLSLPSWYGLEASGPLRLGQMRSLPVPRCEPAGPAGRERRRVPRPTLPAAGPLPQPITPPRRRPHLTLIQGGRAG